MRIARHPQNVGVIADLRFSFAKEFAEKLKKRQMELAREKGIHNSGWNEAIDELLKELENDTRNA